MEAIRPNSGYHLPSPAWKHGDSTPRGSRPQSGRRLAYVAHLLGFIVILLAAASACAYTTDQAQAGERTYEVQCARCHGVDGEGRDNIYKGFRAPELIGPTALPCMPRPFQKLRASAFRDERDVYEFTSALMPTDLPATLDADTYWGVLAYLLQANGRPPDGTRLDATSAADVILHPDCGSPATPDAGEVRR